MLPVHRVPKSQKLKRRSHLRLRPALPVVCPNCGNAKMPHTACRNCGYVRPGLMVKTAASKED